MKSIVRLESVFVGIFLEILEYCEDFKRRKSNSGEIEEAMESDCIEVALMEVKETIPLTITTVVMTKTTTITTIGLQSCSSL